MNLSDDLLAYLLVCAYTCDVCTVYVGALNTHVFVWTCLCSMHKGSCINVHSFIHASEMHTFCFLQLFPKHIHELICTIHYGVCPKYMCMCNINRSSLLYARAGCEKTMCQLQCPRKIKFIHSFSSSLSPACLSVITAPPLRSPPNVFLLMVTYEY